MGRLGALGLRALRARRFGATKGFSTFDGLGALPFQKLAQVVEFTTNVLDFQDFMDTFNQVSADAGLPHRITQFWQQVDDPSFSSLLVDFFITNIPFGVQTTALQAGIVEDEVEAIAVEAFDLLAPGIGGSYWSLSLQDPTNTSITSVLGPVENVQQLLEQKAEKEAEAAAEAVLLAELAENDVLKIIAPTPGHVGVFQEWLSEDSLGNNPHGLLNMSQFVDPQNPSAVVFLKRLTGDPDTWDSVIDQILALGLLVQQMDESGVASFQVDQAAAAELQSQISILQEFANEAFDDGILDEGLIVDFSNVEQIPAIVAAAAAEKKAAEDAKNADVSSVSSQASSASVSVDTEDAGTLAQSIAAFNREPMSLEAMIDTVANFAASANVDSLPAAALVAKEYQTTIEAFSLVIAELAGVVPESLNTALATAKDEFDLLKAIIGGLQSGESLQELQASVANEGVSLPILVAGGLGIAAAAVLILKKKPRRKKK